MPDRPNRTRDHLANERTLLAWIRTGVTLVGLGFVVARFSYLLRTLAAQARRAPPPQSGGGTALGAAIVLAGGGSIVLALRRYTQAREQIERDDYQPGGRSLLALGLLCVAAAVVLAIYIGVGNQAA